MEIPKHIAVIMDGNGRWARARYRPRIMGHHKGLEATRRIVELSAEHGVQYLTLFAFRSENWKRPADEVNGLMSLFVRALDNETQRLLKNSIRLKLIGGLEAFPQKLQQKIQEAEALTANGQRMQLSIAANYGGRWDILHSMKKVMTKIIKNHQKNDQLANITEADIDQALSTQGIPDPDLFIRTGGEQRISNFLLWQLAYTELYFSDTLWPDFDEAEFFRALTFFSGRQRRFGLTGEQIKQGQGQHV